MRKHGALDRADAMTDPVIGDNPGTAAAREQYPRRDLCDHVRFFRLWATPAASDIRTSDCLRR
jgi:hypothetical protein